jgi:transcription initiation factor TFIID TATA-box-binding protein
MELVSVVGGGNLGRELDLAAVSQDFPAPVLEYEPESYPALYIRFEEDGATVMSFTSGKYNIAGAKSVRELRDTNQQFVSTIEDLLSTELESARDSLEVRNMVFVDELRYEVDLNSIGEILGSENVVYEPEQFPALNYRPENYEGLFKIFRTGKITLTGATDPEEAKTEFEKLKEVFDENIERSQTASR